MPTRRAIASRLRAIRDVISWKCAAEHVVDAISSGTCDLADRWRRHRYRASLDRAPPMRTARS